MTAGSDSTEGLIIVQQVLGRLQSKVENRLEKTDILGGNRQ